MRSLRYIGLDKYRIGGIRLRIGNWYHIIASSGNEYIFKFNGIITRHNNIGRDYSYCISDGFYGDFNCKYICNIEQVDEIKRVSRDEVLKYFNDDKL